MRSAIIGAALLLASACPVLAADPAPPATPATPATEATPATPATPATAVTVPESMTSMIGNTVKVVDAKGLESHTYFAADGTFAGVAPAYSYHYQGKWEIAADGKLCRTFDPVPPGIVNPVCSILEAHVVGDSWTDPDGGADTILAGLQ